jgi:hypothetical protein
VRPRGPGNEDGAEAVQGLKQPRSQALSSQGQGQGQVVDFITFYSTSNVFQLLLYTRAVNARISKRN